MIIIFYSLSERFQTKPLLAGEHLLSPANSERVEWSDVAKELGMVELRKIRKV